MARDQRRQHPCCRLQCLMPHSGCMTRPHLYHSHLINACSAIPPVQLMYNLFSKTVGPVPGTSGGRFPDKELSGWPEG